MTPDLLQGLFEAVDNSLAPASRPLDLLAVGGTAMLLRWYPGRVTYDVDLVTPLPPPVKDAVAAAAAPYPGLNPFWLNDGPLTARPPGLEPDDPLVVYAGRNLTVSVAGPRYVLAMKVFAGRDADGLDLPYLFAAAEVDNLDTVYDLHGEAYRGLALHANADRTLREAWAGYAEPRGLPVGLTREHDPYLAVVPADTSWGWEIELRSPTGPPLVGGTRYLSEVEALETGDFILDLVDHHYPVRFEGWAYGWEHETPPPGDTRVAVRPVPSVGGWLLRATHPGGDIAAYSPSYPTHQAAADAQSFLQQVSITLGDPEQRPPAQIRSGAACACTRRGRTCAHHDPHATPPLNPVTVSVRPHRAAASGWELVVRGSDKSPVHLSDTHPSKDDAEAARDFALAVANAPRPNRFEGWAPWLTDGPGYVPPTPEEAATTVRVRPPTDQAPDTWRLQATRADGSVLRTSLPHPSRDAAYQSLDFVGWVNVLTGDPTRTGWVLPSTTPSDLICDCRSLRVPCRHHIEAPNTRGPDRAYPSPDLGL